MFSSPVMRFLHIKIALGEKYLETKGFPRNRSNSTLLPLARTTETLELGSLPKIKTIHQKCGDHMPRGEVPSESHIFLTKIFKWWHHNILNFSILWSSAFPSCSWHAKHTLEYANRVLHAISLHVKAYENPTPCLFLRFPHWLYKILLATTSWVSTPHEFVYGIRRGMFMIIRSILILRSIMINGMAIIIVIKFSLEKIYCLLIYRCAEGSKPQEI